LNKKARFIYFTSKIEITMDSRYYIGIDIAKGTARRPGLDWAVFDGKSIVLKTNTLNSVTGIKLALRLLKNLPGWNAKQVVFCMEHTAAAAAGIYNAHLLEFLYRLQLPICGAARRLEDSLQIKRAGGVQRWKTDTIDAQRVAEYAYRFRDRMRQWQPPRLVVQQLAFLSTTHQRLIQVYNQLANPLDEQKSFISPTLQKQLQKSCKASLAALEKDRKAIDKSINTLIEEDACLKELFGLITARRPGSVPGIGVTTATEMVTATNELKTIDDPKKLACHAGVAPFEYKSGVN
jgi:transposase